MDKTNPKLYCLEIRGDFACFTRPELKVERVSYDVITPSAARNIFQCIFWKPAIQWHVRRIEVLKPIRRTSIRRNEVGSTMSPKATKPLFIEENRQQRTAYILQDVAYRIYAEMEFIPLEKRTKKQQEECKDPKAETPEKYDAIFLERATKGQCFTQPYLGCREFTCSFEYIPRGQEQDLPIDESRDLGIMLFDMDFEKNLHCPPSLFFHAQMEHGVIEVPHKSSKEILR